MTIATRCIHRLRKVVNLSLNRASTINNHAKLFSTSLKPSSVYSQSLPLLSTPWLMLPPDVKDGPDGLTDNYFSILDKTTVKLDRPKAHGMVPADTKCFGTTRGWVTFIRDSDNRIFLADPYTEGCSIKLPRFRNVFNTGFERFQCTVVGNPASKSFALFIIETFSTDDPDGDSYYYRNKKPDVRFYTSKKPHLNWESLEDFGQAKALLVYKRKDSSVYNLQWEESGPLVVNCLDVLCDDAPKVTNNVLFGNPLVDGKGVLSFFLDDNPEIASSSEDLERYLVVPVGDGDGSRPERYLFLVIRHLYADEDENEGPKGPTKTKAIHLFKIDLEKKKVEDVKSLGDQMIFIGSNSEPFIILSARTCPGLKSNSIYIADDLGVYDLETKCVTPFLSLGDCANIRPQVYWVAPRS